MQDFFPYASYLFLLCSRRSPKRGLVGERAMNDWVGNMLRSQGQRRLRRETSGQEAGVRSRLRRPHQPDRAHTRQP